MSSADVRQALLIRARPALEVLGLPFLALAWRVIRLYRPSFHHTSKWNQVVADRLGVWPTLDYYHEPLVSPKRIDSGRARRARDLPGLDLRLSSQLELLSELRFGDELEALARRQDAASDIDLRPTFDNLAFGPGDGEALYSLIRRFKPARVVEVGAGHSTRFAKVALDRNAADGAPGRHVCVEPYESPWLEALGVEVIRKPVEEVSDSFFAELEAGDIFFIDSSHVVRPQGDVLHLLHGVLPNLAPGVMVHVHDIFTPRDYPLAWLERRWFWDEQYVLEALLVNNARYEVMLGLNQLFHDERRALMSAFPVLGAHPQKEPGSFYFRVKESTAS
ncbi:MAG: class I SAM-dependent methyltransferase [Solirubrobacterales bacterium]|nr:class I SAM-dependent methyltransferase [Solirubrobacterales bacterium]